MEEEFLHNPPSRPTYDPKNFNVWDYDPAKFEHELKRNYGDWSIEELYGLNYGASESKKIIAQKRMDNYIIGASFFLLLAIIWGQVRTTETILQSFENKLMREIHAPK